MFYVYVIVVDICWVCGFVFSLFLSLCCFWWMLCGVF